MHRDEMTRAAARHGIPNLFLNRHWADWRYHDLCDILDHFQIPGHHRGDSGPRETKIEIAVRVYSFFVTRTQHHHNLPGSLAELASRMAAKMYLYPQIVTRTQFYWPYSTPLKALVDSGSSRNIFASEMIDIFQFEPNGTQALKMTSVTGDTLETRGPYFISISLQDSYGRTLISRLRFYSADIKRRGFDMILGMPWCAGQVGGDMNMRTRRWRFAENRLDVNMEFPIADQQEEDELEHGRDSDTDDADDQDEDEEEEEEEEDEEELWWSEAEEDDDSGENQDYDSEEDEEYYEEDDEEDDSETDEEYSSSSSSEYDL